MSKIVVKVYNTKTEKKVSALVMKTDVKDFILTWDSLIIAYALGIRAEDVSRLNIGEYELRKE